MESNKHPYPGQSVTGVVIQDGKVLLARHTYGAGKGRLIIPGGYVNPGETPQEALKREFLEETGAQILPTRIIGIRFNMHDWYVAFAADYLGGTVHSDGQENSEVCWMETAKALERDDVPELTRALIQAALHPDAGLWETPFQSSEKYAPYSLYAARG